MIEARDRRVLRVVVGVDGSGGGRSALLWAADEARLRRDTLLVAHAPDVTDAALVARAWEAALRAVDEIGERLLRSCAAAASTRQPSIPVTTLLSHSSAADALIDLSLDADLVVVGSQGFGGIVSSVLGSVSRRVAAHAHCAVAVVPEAAVLRTRRPAARVVVGLSPDPAARLALEFAADEALRRAATLTVLTAIGDGAAAHSAGTDLDAVRVGNPGLDVESIEVAAGPATALLDAARDAQLLVIGCHHSDDHWSTRLSRVPSEVIHRAACPVVVVGPARHSADARHSSDAPPVLVTDFA